MEEITYLNAIAATVTSTRITIGNQTFATRNVGSVAVEEVAKPNWPIVIGMIGAVMLVSSWSGGVSATSIMGVVMIGGAAAIMFSPQKLRLKLNAGGGEIMALETTDRSAINTLHQAIVSAISAR